MNEHWIFLKHWQSIIFLKYDMCEKTEGKYFVYSGGYVKGRRQGSIFISRQKVKVKRTFRLSEKSPFISFKNIKDSSQRWRLYLFKAFFGCPLCQVMFISTRSSYLCLSWGRQKAVWFSNDAKELVREKK